MLEKAKNMNNEKVSSLPADFDGVFRFTNYTNREFKARWNSVEYAFPAEKTTPMIIPNATPEEVQNIRKKFAKELAVREFYETDKFKEQNKIRGEQGTPALYTDSDIAPFIQRCLEPLPLGQAKIAVLPKDNEANYKKNSKGKNVTRVLDETESLTQQSSGPIDE